MADRYDAKHSRPGIDFIHDPIAPDAIAPLTLELSNERNPFVWIEGDG
jgi:hypothetical protein